ncbi:MAG TPA: AmmeMemoRadiSam system protein B [Caldilineae bacterium]|nr:AmmeMemoRadiSam system protein B [Caldilineae bacterium]
MGPAVHRGTVRPEAVAGTFYPAQPAVLRRGVITYIEQARPPRLPGRPRAVIAPHAGYIYSGPIAGYSYRVLSSLPPRPRVVYLMGPAHHVPISGVAVGTFAAFRTPLGEAPVDMEIVEQLLRLGAPFTENNHAHLPEHCLEVQIPFLQVVLDGHFRLVPLLFGQVNPQPVASALEDLLADDPDALVVVSSDLSHYHPYDTARRLDQATLQAVLRGDLAGAANGEACGIVPMLTLMFIADQLGWEPHLLDYRNSGDTAGDRLQVVGYGAVAYTESATE